MGLFTPGGAHGEDGAAEDLRRAGEKRRKKLEKQEKRVKRLSAPLLPWLARVFRAVAALGTVGMTVAEFSSCRMAEAYYGQADYLGRMSCTAFFMWSVAGGIWFFSSLGVLHSIKTGKADEETEEKEDMYRRDAKISLIIWAVLFVLFLIFWVF